MNEKEQGIKLLEIIATTAYPIVSAYEYEFLKQEEIVRERMKAATVYFILQRPLTFFDNLAPGDGELTFDIWDGVNPPLKCQVDLSAYDVEPGTEVSLEVQYFREPASKIAPYREVAAFRLRKLDDTLIVWETPQKLLYEVLANGLKVSIEGDIAPYLKFHVHYIGQAFAQKVWDRLTGHEKMQKILTLEAPLSSLTTRPPFEISILMLSVVGMNDASACFNWEAVLPKDAKPILHEFDFEDDNNSFEKYQAPLLALGAPELTNEVEALLINLFKPEYNEKLFKNYPNIKNGTRSAGYTHTELIIERLPAVLSTKQHTETSIFIGSLGETDA
ncbi:hypothetical protein [Mesorhizobium sp. A556]